MRSYISGVGKGKKSEVVVGYFDLPTFPAGIGWRSRAGSAREASGLSAYCQSSRRFPQTSEMSLGDVEVSPQRRLRPDGNARLERLIGPEQCVDNLRLSRRLSTAMVKTP